MKQFLRFISRRERHDGWALIRPGDVEPDIQTVSTTRQEVREQLPETKDILHPTKIVKVRIKLEVVHD